MKDFQLNCDKGTTTGITPNLKPLPDFSEWGFEAVRVLCDHSSKGRSTFLVKAVSNQQLYVLKKVTFLSSANWDEIRQVTEGEFGSLQKIKHPRVPSPITLINPQNEDWIGMVQEFLPGTPLSQLSLSAAELQQVIEDVLDVLVAAQRVQVAHLDLKPENILVDDEGRASVVDFGIARRIRTDNEEKATTQLGWTAGFTDPRVVFLNKKPDGRSDLYGLGCTIISKLLDLSSSEFRERFGMDFNAEQLGQLDPPNGVSRELWDWLLELVQINLTDVPTSAREALRSYKELSPIDSKGTNTSSLSVGKSSSSLREFWIALCTFVVFTPILITFDPLGIYETTQPVSHDEELALPQNEPRVAAPELPAWSPNMIIAGEALEDDSLTGTLYVSEGAYQRLLPKVMPQGKDALVKSTDELLEVAAAEYTSMFRKVSGVADVEVDHVGIHLTRANTEVSWEDIIAGLEAILTAEENLQRSETQRLTHLSCLDGCFHTEPTAGTMLLSVDGDKSWAELGIDADDLFRLRLQIFTLSGIGTVTLGQETATIEIGQGLHYHESWPVLATKVDRIVGSFLD